MISTYDGENLQLIEFRQDNAVIVVPDPDRHNEMSTSGPQHSHFEMDVTVSAEDIDEQDHVNNMVYLRWVQEIATAHWCAVASPEAQTAVGWVVLRHEIDYKTPAFVGEEIALRTWVGKATRLTFERFTEIRRRSDGRLLSNARTLWCPIHPITGRPSRVSSEVRKQFST